MTNLDRLWILFMFFGTTLVGVDNNLGACLFVTAATLFAVASMANEGFRNK